MKFGVIARADGGGLAAMTGEVARHLLPDRVLVMDMHMLVRGTGTDPSRFEPWCDQLFVTRYRLGGHETEHFLDGLDVVYTAETIYDDRLYSIARARRVKIVLHVMPELFGPSERQADVLWNPTSWMQDRLPRAEVMPMPIATDVLSYRNRGHVETLFCTTGEAMLDRNGMQTMMAALPLIERPVRLLIRGGPERSPFTVGKVDVEWLPPVATYEQVIPDEADVLVMPRRYGGLCLPAFEAAAHGVLPIMSRVSPQTDWFDDDLLVPAHEILDVHEMRKVGGQTFPVPMKGGTFPIFDVDHVDLATRINWLLDSRSEVQRLSARVHDWAVANSWHALRARWIDGLERAAQ